MKTFNSVLVMSGAAAAAVLLFAAPAAACDRDDHGSHPGYHVHQGGDRNGVLTGDILSNNCSVLNIVAFVDC